MITLALFVTFALGVSFLCSLLEATLLAARNPNLEKQAEAGNRGAGMLLDLKRHRVDDAISAILILNTASNTLGATMAGAQAARVFGSNWVGLFSGVLTLGILVISEIIPKTLGAVYPRKLAGFVGRALYALTLAMTPALFISRVLTKWLTRGRETQNVRVELSTVIAAASRDGSLGLEESKMLGNLLKFTEIQVKDVMTPRTVVFSISKDATLDQLLAHPEAEVFSRIPLYDENPTDIVGYVLKMEVYKAIAENADRGTTVARFLRKIDFVPELASVGQALRQISKGRDPIAMTTDEHGTIVGIVTLEDLTETILGVEIIDESDRIADMRVLAARIRDRRLERMRKRREQPSDDEKPWIRSVP